MPWGTEKPLSPFVHAFCPRSSSHTAHSEEPSPSSRPASETPARRLAARASQTQEGHKASTSHSAASSERDPDPQRPARETQQGHCGPVSGGGVVVKERSISILKVCPSAWAPAAPALMVSTSSQGDLSWGSSHGAAQASTFALSCYPHRPPRRAESCPQMRPRGKKLSKPRH